MCGPDTQRAKASSWPGPTQASAPTEGDLLSARIHTPRERLQTASRTVPPCPPCFQPLQPAGGYRDKGCRPGRLRCVSPAGYCVCACSRRRRPRMVLKTPPLSIHRRSNRHYLRLWMCVHVTTPSQTVTRCPARPSLAPSACSCRATHVCCCASGAAAPCCTTGQSSDGPRAERGSSYNHRRRASPHGEAANRVRWGTKQP